MAMVGCENPNYLCGFDPANNLLSHGAFTSVRSSDSVKNALGLAIGAPVIAISNELAPRGAREWRNVSHLEPRKVSVYLFNSILTL